MYEYIRDIVEQKHRVLVHQSKNIIFLYSQNKDIDDTKLLEINASIKEYKHCFVQNNSKMAILKLI